MKKALALKRPDLANVIATLASEGKISFSEIMRDLPSFLSAKWNVLAPNFGLTEDLSAAKFESHSIDTVLLPPSFHEATSMAAWQIQDVYQE